MRTLFDSLCILAIFHQGYKMALCANPNRLTDLAMASLGSYISDLFDQLLTCGIRHPAEVFKKTCKHLQEIIYNTIPPIFANQITAHLLYYLNKAENAARYRAYKQLAVDQLVGAILHPSLTALKFVDEWSHPTSRCELSWNVVLSIHNNVHRLKNIKVLEYGRVRFFRNDLVPCTINVSQNLEHFTFWKFCNNELLKDLASKCSRLKSIDVCSSMEVTDKSVEFLLEFRHLVDLNVKETNISKRGLARLLKGFCEAERTSGTLKGIGLTEITPSHMKLVKNHQNLTSLTLRYAIDNLSPLKTLKHLNKLTVSHFLPKVVIDLLSAIGTQLVFLDIRHHHVPFDFRLIVVRCPSLRCLHAMDLYFELDLDFLMDSDKKLYISFCSKIECLRIQRCRPHNYLEYLVSKCKKLKELCVENDAISACQLLESVLPNNQLFHLEKYYWGGWEHDRASSGGDVIVNRPTEESICVSVVHPFQRGKILLRTKQVQISPSP